MISKRDIHNAWQIDSLTTVSITAPNKRFVLWIIANDPNAFGSTFMIDAVTKGIHQPNSPDSNFSKALSIYISLQKLRYVKSVSYDYNKITWRGQLYRLYTHPARDIWAILVGLIAIGVCVLLWLQSNNQPKPTGKIQQPISDSLLHRQKIRKDSSKEK
jgi:hypothetical protein